MGVSRVWNILETSSTQCPYLIRFLHWQQDRKVASDAES